MARFDSCDSLLIVERDSELAVSPIPATMNGVLPFGFEADADGAFVDGFDVLLQGAVQRPRPFLGERDPDLVSTHEDGIVIAPDGICGHVPDKHRRISFDARALNDSDQIGGRRGI